jgi:glycosyltransferase involved in cell wall biosynthesis
VKKTKQTSIIALFFHRYRWGFQIRGDERGFFEKAKEFKRMGITLNVLEKAPSFQDGTGYEAYRSLKISGCRIPPTNPLELCALLIFTVVMLFQWNLPRPAAIYSYNQDVENVLPGLALRMLTGSPLVVIHHQIEGSSVASFRRSIANKRMLGYSFSSTVWRSIFPALNRFALSKADVHIALSEAAKNDMEKLIGNVQCSVIGNGVDIRKFRPIQIPKIYDAAFLGRLAPQKGIDILLKAWQTVTSKLPRARLVLIGGGDEFNLKKYRRMIGELGLVDNVVMLGFQSDEKVVELLNSSKLFIFPSRKEGFAQAVSQAMACGMCCILSDIPALREYYGKNAVLVPPENYIDLGSTVIELLCDEARRAKYQGIARETVVGLSWHDTVSRELRAITEFSLRNE